MIKIDHPTCKLLAALTLAAASAGVYAGDSRVFSADCGTAKFRVTAVNNGYAFDNSYTLSAANAAGQIELYKAQDWFHAACVTAKTGQPLLIFQNYCSGSACREKIYGAVDPTTLSLLIKPNDNIENVAELSAFLGFAAPSLSDYPGAFCCAEKPDTPAVASAEPQQPPQAQPPVVVAKKPSAQPAKQTLISQASVKQSAPWPELTTQQSLTALAVFGFGLGMAVFWWLNKNKKQ